MSFKSALIQSAFIVRWVAHEAGDGRRLLQAAVSAKAQCSGPMVYIAIAPADVPPPSDKVRDELAETLDRLLEHCSCVHLVIEATGFRGVVARAAATGIFMVTGKRGRVSPHVSVEEALTSCKHLDARSAQILSSAKLQGLLDSPGLQTAVLHG